MRLLDGAALLAALGVGLLCHSSTAIDALRYTALQLANSFLGLAISLASYATPKSPDAADALLADQPPIRFDVARSEAEVNHQQRHSAQLYSRIAEAYDLSGTEDVQLDDVRATLRPLAPDAHEHKCGQKLPPESLVVTRGVEIFCRSTYSGFRRGQHTWTYRIEFRNGGGETVQMLSRHWLFVDADGGVQEVKGPGARGVTPVLRPGDSWEYESGTSLATPSGSMRGYFLFESLHPGADADDSFVARVGRLSLSSTNGLELTPCGEETPSTMLTSTSVRATQRVIVGAQVAPIAAAEGEPQRFVWDIQVNNAREAAVHVKRHRWELIDSKGGHAVVQGKGIGGFRREEVVELPAGEATRARGVLEVAQPPANAWGSFDVELQRGEDTVEVKVEIGMLGLSATDEERVPYLADA